MCDMFKDRKDAGEKLARVLREYRGKNAIVLALPRGGVVLGYEVAKALKLPLDIIAVRKIGHPVSPEYAIGAVDDEGTVLLDDDATAGIDRRALQAEIAREQKEAQRRSALYRGGKKPLQMENRTVILIDDGIATGLTMRLAVRNVRSQHPKKIVVAAPVASIESQGALKREGVDEIVILDPPEDFLGAVGAHYARFEQVGDDEVIHLLAGMQT